MATNVAAQIMDTIMSIPGMNEPVKIDLKISRKNVLLLSSVIERGLADTGQDKDGILSNIPEKELEELKAIGSDALQKAGLVELSEKLSLLQGNK